MGREVAGKAREKNNSSAAKSDTASTQSFLEETGAVNTGWDARGPY